MATLAREEAEDVKQSIKRPKTPPIPEPFDEQFSASVIHRSETMRSGKVAALFRTEIDPQPKSKAKFAKLVENIDTILNHELYIKEMKSKSSELLARAQDVIEYIMPEIEKNINVDQEDILEYKEQKAKIEALTKEVAKFDEIFKYCKMLRERLEQEDSEDARRAYETMLVRYQSYLPIIREQLQDLEREIVNKETIKALKEECHTKEGEEAKETQTDKFFNLLLGFSATVQKLIKKSKNVQKAQLSREQEAVMTAIVNSLQQTGINVMFVDLPRNTISYRSIACEICLHLLGIGFNPHYLEFIVCTARSAEILANKAQIIQQMQKLFIESFGMGLYQMEILGKEYDRNIVAVTVWIVANEVVLSKIILEIMYNQTFVEKVKLLLNDTECRVVPQWNPMLGNMILNMRDFNPNYNKDYTHIPEKKAVDERGGTKYFRPRGWKGYGLYVDNKYEDIQWLDRGPKEWPVAYTGFVKGEGAPTKSWTLCGVSAVSRTLSGKMIGRDAGVLALRMVAPIQKFDKDYDMGSKKYKYAFMCRVNLADRVELCCPEELDSYQLRDLVWVVKRVSSIRPYRFLVYEEDSAVTLSKPQSPKKKKKTSC